MIKFEVIVNDKETVIGDFKIPPGQRALKITLDCSDLVEAIALDDGDFTDGVIYLWGTKLAALERMLRESKRKGIDHGE